MERKECDKVTSTYRRTRLGFVVASVCCAGLVTAHEAAGQTIRLLRAAVVTEREVTLDNVCRFTGFEEAILAKVGSTGLGRAPRIGRTMRITSDQVRAALRRAGVNDALTVVVGASVCEVSTPRKVDAAYASQRPVESGDQPTPTVAAESTLRDAVREMFQERAEAYGGEVSVDFLHAPAGLLDLGEPEHTFALYVRQGRWIGPSVRVDVDVFKDGAAVRTARVTVRTSLSLRVVTARGPVNQQAQVRPDDVETTVRTFDSVASLPVLDPEAVIGLRAKRFIPVGSAIHAKDLEPVPLVRRGQMVKVSSVAGSVEVFSAAKSREEGGLGDLVRLQSGRRRGEQITGIVVGERHVRVGGSMVTVAGTIRGGGHAR